MVMVLNRRIWRFLSENLAQFSGSIVLILLSCFVFTGMTLMGTNLKRLADDFETHYVLEDASFTTDQRIENVAEIETAADAVIEEAKTFDTPLSEGITLRVFSQNERVDIPAIMAGSPLTASGQVLLNPVFAETHGFQIGDTLTIQGRPFTIVGYMALPHYIYPLQSETDLMYSQQKFGLAAVSKADFDAFRQGASAYALRFNHPAENPRVQAAQFKALLAGKGVHVLQWTAIDDNKRVSYVGMKLDAIATFSKVMPVSLLVLTSILTCTVMARMIGRERAVIGGLYALGYTRKELYRHYLTFPIVFALIGGILGTGIGLLSARGMVMFMLTAFTIPLTGIQVDLSIVIASLLLPVVFLGASSLVVIWKQLTYSPVELMKGESEKTQVNFLERALKLDRLSFSAKFKIREQVRSLSRLAFLLVGCAVATMLILYGATIKSSLDSLSKDMLTGTFHFENEYIFKNLQDSPPPAGTQPFSPALFLAEGENQREFYVNGIDLGTALISFVDEAGAPLSLDQVIMTKPLADKLNVKAGDRVALIRKLDEQKFSVKIDAIADTYVGKYIFMPLPAYRQTFHLPEGSYLGLWSPGALDIPQDQLYSHKSIDDSLAALKESTVAVQYMIIGYSFVAFLIGLIVIFLVTSMIIDENKVSISLLKIFGYRKREVNQLVLNSSTIVVVIGYLIGIPLILSSMDALLQSLDNSVGLTLPVMINPLYIGIGFGVVLASYEVSKLLCHKKVNAVPMSEALKSGTE